MLGDLIGKTFKGASGEKVFVFESKLMVYKYKILISLFFDEKLKKELINLLNIYLYG